MSKSSSRGSPVFWAGLITVLSLIAAGLITGLALNEEQRSVVWLELVKALLTVSIVASLGGVLKLMFDGHKRQREKSDRELELRREDRKRQLEFRRNILDDLKSIHDRIERARLLIAAHKSAKTYGEQMREMIGARVALMEVKRAIGYGESDLESADDLTEHLRSMRDYLEELLDEYRRDYKDVSRIQRAEEEANSQMVERSVKEGQPEPVFLDLPWSNQAWMKLEGFTKLEDFLGCDRETDYKRTYVKAYDTAVGLIRRQIIEPDRASPLGGSP